jgi:hypothetical protein
MRLLADFILDSDLCLADGAEPLTFNAPDGSLLLMLSNVSGAEDRQSAVLAAQMVFDADSLEDVRTPALEKLAACRTEPFRDWVSGVFGHVCRAEYAVRAPSALRFSRACRDGPLSVAVNCAPGLPAQSGRGEDEHSLQIPGHRHQTPFAANFIEPAQ